MKYTEHLKLKKPSLDEPYNVEDFNENADKTDAAFGNKADKSAVKSATLLSSAWTGDTAPYSITIDVEEATETNIIEINPAETLTTEQYEAMAEALIEGAGQTAGSITLKAYGEKPEVDLPIEIIIRGDR